MRTFGLLLLGFFTMCVTGTVHAAQPVAQSQIANGISMTPAIQDRVLGPVDKTTSFKVELFNNTDKPITLSLSTADFSALNQTGGVAFLGGKVSDVTLGHGLSGYLKLDLPLITLAPQTTKTVTASINDVSKLAPGGHYAAVIARTVATNNPDTLANKVSINQALSSLVFLETAGKGSKSLALLTPDVDKVSFSLPSSVNLVFKATGNTQVTPRGVVDVLHSNKTTQHAIMNENSSLVLPGSSRLLQTSLVGSQHPWWPGKYTLRVQYRFDGSLGITTYEKSFLYINVQAFIVMALLVGLITVAAVKVRKYWAARVIPTPEQIITKRAIRVRDATPTTQKIVVSKVSKSKQQ
jgi:hypothetical protein